MPSLQALELKKKYFLHFEVKMQKISYIKSRGTNQNSGDKTKNPTATKMNFLWDKLGVESYSPESGGKTQM